MNEGWTATQASVLFFFALFTQEGKSFSTLRTEIWLYDMTATNGSQVHLFSQQLGPEGMALAWAEAVEVDISAVRR